MSEIKLAKLEKVFIMQPRSLRVCLDGDFEMVLVTNSTF